MALFLQIVLPPYYQGFCQETRKKLKTEQLEFMMNKKRFLEKKASSFWKASLTLLEGSK